MPLVLVLCISGTAKAGPSIPATAAPGFNDPLSRVRATGVANRDDATNPPADTPEGTPFTIIGQPGAERLEEPEIDDIADPENVQFDRQSNAPLNEETSFATGVAGAPVSGSLASLAQALINQSSGGRNTGGGDQAADDPNGIGASNSLLSAAIQTNLTDMVIAILNPKFETDGLVTFSLAGFGHFALLALGESGGIFLVDMENGTAIKIHEDAPGTAQNMNVSGMTHGTNVAQTTGNTNGVQRLLDFLDTYILPIATSPITLAVAALSLMGWVVWRVSAREP